MLVHCSCSGPVHLNFPQIQFVYNILLHKQIWSGLLPEYNGSMTLSKVIAPFQVIPTKLEENNLPSALLNKKGRFEVFCSRSIFGLLGREFSLIKSILKKLEKNNLQSTLLNRIGTAFQEVRILFTGINYVRRKL